MARVNISALLRFRQGRFLVLGWVLFVAAATVRAELVSQRLDPASSSAIFSVSSDLLSFQGRLRRYSGRLELDPHDIRRSQVEITASASDLEINDDSPLAGLNSALAGVTAAPATFVSTSIDRLAGNRYRVRGVVRQGSRREQATVEVTVRAAAPARTEIVLSSSGPVASNAFPIPLPVQFQNARGRVTAELVFLRMKQ